jgi:hypothetical protein
MKHDSGARGIFFSVCWRTPRRAFHLDAAPPSCLLFPKSDDGRENGGKQQYRARSPRGARAIVTGA